MPADGLIQGVIDMTESNLGFASRWKIETDEIKKKVMLEAFFSYSPVDKNDVPNFDSLSFDAVVFQGRNYTPKESTNDVLQARYNFVVKHLAIALEEDGNNLLPLHIYLNAIEQMEDSGKKEILKYLIDTLIKITTGAGS